MDDILWIGSVRSEFDSTTALIEQASRVRRVGSLVEAHAAAVPSIAILAQSRPGEFTESKVHELRTRWPNTRFVYLLGSWCCGLKRTGDEFSRITTVYAYQSDASKIRAILGHRSSSNPQIRVASAASNLVAVYSPLAGYRAALADALAQFGLKTVEAEADRTIRMHGVDAVVWHAAIDFELREEELDALLNRHPRALIIALLTFPRDFELTRLRSRGVRVLAQPFELADLVEVMQDAAPDQVSSAA